ncbi:MAG: EamA family transporter, partial [Clostridia bacterium]|nr:EamA family transporter [Clostridia bacterium]
DMTEDAVDLACSDILNTAYEFTWFFMAIIFAVYVFVIKREKIEVKSDGTKMLGGLCETLGQVFYMSVVVSGNPVGFVIISSYCAVSVLWSRIFLKEKLSLKHYIAIATAFIGIFILGIYDV